MGEVTAKEALPFRFFTRLHLSELTGLKASDLEELAVLVKTVPGACIYYHTHRFLQQHQYLSPEPPNDFAHWVSEMLGERQLGEKLASIDTVQYTTIRSLRDKISEMIDRYISANQKSKRRSVHEGDEFHFIKAVSFVLPTSYVAHDLEEFVSVLEKITIDSIYFHIFESRLRLEKGNNDFSQWIDASFGDKETARSISKLDPYTYTMENLRKKMIAIIKRKTK
ncbi:MAG: DUF5752 family protein [Candidatus Margulisiibacteriota bacterium]